MSFFFDLRSKLLFVIRSSLGSTGILEIEILDKLFDTMNVWHEMRKITYYVLVLKSISHFDYKMRNISIENCNSSFSGLCSFS